MAKREHEGGAGPTQRQLRVGEVVRRALSEALMRGETHEPELDGASITVSEVRLSPDLKIATAYVMPLGGANGQATIKALARAKGELRRIVGRQAQLKFAPDLRFRLDSVFDQFDETRRLLDDPRVKGDLDAGDRD
ncbi:30S ribosome-binding factor RbfA [Pikeienuella piscinae]|uniref:Ribosome-binding factor A n=1 Tax=Pikeienuella piscinae TaxID=2748098 RepID=A0A7L5BYI6_9RHOB|nr:30S ribosome-binding factor RbfA [Pikeienuella piscinae]QIE56812.1 30S ribosome-binding factor RbfA [Pikeienuella piscinae]